MKRALLMLVVGVVGFQSSNAFTQETHARRTQVTFGARRHLDTLADRMRREANTVCWEMYHNYQHEPGYRQTYREMYDVLEDSHHIHDLVHDDAHRGTDNEEHIVEDLHNLDRLFHHIEDDIRKWNSRNRFHNHDLDHKMERLETTLHHLMEDYGVRSKRKAPKPTGPSKPPVPRP